MHRHNRSRLSKNPQRTRTVRLSLFAAVLALFSLVALLSASAAGAIVPDYTALPNTVTCSTNGSTTTCAIDANVDPGSTFTVSINGSVSSTSTFTGGPVTIVSPTTGSTAVVTFVSGGITYSSTEQIAQPNPTPTPVPPTPTPVPDYGFGNGIPTRPAPLAVTGSNVSWLVGGGLAMVLTGAVMMTRRPIQDELD